MACILRPESRLCMCFCRTLLAGSGVPKTSHVPFCSLCNNNAHVQRKKRVCVCTCVCIHGRVDEWDCGGTTYIST